MLGVDQENLAGILFCLSDMHLFFLINVAYIVIEMTLLVFDFFTYHEVNLRGGIFLITLLYTVILLA